MRFLLFCLVLGGSFGLLHAVGLSVHAASLAAWPITGLVLLLTWSASRSAGEES